MEDRIPAAVDMDLDSESGSKNAQVDKVFHFGSAREPSEPHRRERSGGRDWAAAIDLVKEASDAIHLAEKKAAEAETYSQQLISRHREQTKAAEARIAAAERRADAATKRAVEAEEWLVKFHDAIIKGFEGFVREVA